MIGLVLVSHSDSLTVGVAELAAQMAPEVSIATAGGTDDGEIGTSFDKTLAALSAAPAEGAVILYDLGSAKMTAELALEMLDDDSAKRLRLVAAPLVEGAIAAAVAAAGGAGLDAVAAAAEGAAAIPDHGASAGATSEGEPAHQATFTLRNPLGLHARPAAALTRLVPLGDPVRIGRPGAASDVDIHSVLAVVGLGLRGGDKVQVSGAKELVDAVGAAIEAGFGELDEIPQHVSSGEGPRAAVGGVAIGTLSRLAATEPDVLDEPDDPSRAATELQRAIAAVAAELERESDPAGLAAAHGAIVTDPVLRDAALERTAAGSSAASAWWRAVEQVRGELATATDALIRERGADVTDVGLRVLAQLRPELVTPPQLPPGIEQAIVVADDLVPSAVAPLRDAGAVGLVLAHSGVTSHTVVVARSLGIPTLVGYGAATDTLADGVTAVLDGDAGTLNTNPTSADVAAARQRIAHNEMNRTTALETAQEPVVLADGRHIEVAANIGSLTDAAGARAAGADGVGLLRTELLFLDRAELPTETEQASELREIFAALGEVPVTVRTLDVGGDKALPALHLDPQHNGFLGVRGLRHGLAHPTVLSTQIKAVMRAAADWGGTLRLMAPMVTVAAEVRQFRGAVQRAAAELTEAGVAHRVPDELGIMVEVPAAAIAPDDLLSEVDFVSVGSNDLVQYLMAAERTNEAVAHLYQPNHPAVWTALQLLVSAATDRGVPVAVCGEMASVPEVARRLVALGVSELSMSAAAIPEVKAALRG